MRRTRFCERRRSLQSAKQETWFKNPDGPHAGDLPDMYVNKDGVGHYEAFMESISLGSGETSVFDTDGSAVVVHATADDNVTDPAGNSGDRIGCGIVSKTVAKGM